MSLKWRTIHTFPSDPFTASVREYPDGHHYRISVNHLGEDANTGQLHLFELLCLTAEEALLLSKLLKVAAAMAGHLDTGGTVEKWEAIARLPYAEN